MTHPEQPKYGHAFFINSANRVTDNALLQRVKRYVFDASEWQQEVAAIRAEALREGFEAARQIKFNGTICSPNKYTTFADYMKSKEGKT